MADGGRRVQIHRLDAATCAITGTRTNDIDPSDPEDLARGPGGSLWVGDTGDNDLRRSSVAVIVLSPRGEAQLHRLTYPDGAHDAEALLVDTAGRPVVVTKDAGPAGVYRSEVPPDGPGPTPLVRVGTVSLPASDTAGGPIGGLGSRVVTGAAASADGRVVALRTYTDAWLYRVPDGDIVAALAGTPVRVPLPGEPQGEAIAFGPDGTLLSGSETRGGVPGEIRAIPGAAGLVGQDLPAAPSSAPATAPERERPERDEGEGTPEWLPAAVGGGIAVALLLLAAGLVAVRGMRRGR
jgi:hypothetical protein